MRRYRKVSHDRGRFIRETRDKRKLYKRNTDLVSEPSYERRSNLFLTLETRGVVVVLTTLVSVVFHESP